MSLLDQLWDDTVAGPCPDSGLGKLRKRSTSFGFRSNNSSKEEILMDRNAARSVGENVSEDNEVRVTRSIMIMKQPPQIGDQTAAGGGCTPPASPAAGSTPPVSPLSVLDFQEEEEEEVHFGFVEGLHRMHMRRQVGLEAGALVLLMTCEM